ncbi:MAG: YicC/YloC family endoribonuclease [Bacteroidota bacterium]|nr:YicC/YloC family endoribonuclease [Bacteroidota bacterium]
MAEIKSMTGYGLSESENNQWRVKAEIKSLNNKFLELNIRLPKSFKDKDIEARQLLTNKIIRGSVSVNINAERKDNQNINDSLSINIPLAKSYFQKIESLTEALNIPNENLLNTILTLPDIMKYDETDGLEEDWALIKTAILQAFENFDQFRIQEGEFIKKYLKTCIEEIRLNIEAIAQHEIPRKESVKDKLWQSLLENKEEGKIDKNRYEQELIYYLEKYDIAEEKSRLSHHIAFFNECLEKEANGKKLGFISQEMGREINTIGSKANYFPIQQSVIIMKEELEKIKEQLLNVL